MSGSCCIKLIIKTIDVNGIEIDILGLETIFINVSLLNIKDEGKLKSELLRWTNLFGNSTTDISEYSLKDALLREYKAYKSLIA